MDSGGPSLYANADPSVDLTQSIEDDSVGDEPLISVDALHSAIRREFKTVTTHWLAGLLTLLHVLFMVLSVCVAVLCVLNFGQKEVCASVLGNLPGDSVVVLGKACLWVLVLLFTWYVQHHHNQARRRGYLQFYREVQGLKHLPLTIHSIGNVAVLVVMVAELVPPVRTYLLLSILALELLVAVPCVLYYTVKVIRYNRERAAPDVSREEHLHINNVTSLPTETGFRGSSSLEEVVEKQADLIEYLKQHNTLLSKRLLNLTAQH
uniref:transmembrane protein 192 n=1 Tax=Monopterus albus TaxID=43700 RepID=UPI0009B2ED3B|nr:transmembrane protein 192 [Monopterus albus]